MKKCRSLGLSSALLSCLVTFGMSGCLAAELDEPSQLEGSETADSDGIATSERLSEQALAERGMDPSLACFGSWVDHAHSQGVAREQLSYAFCDNATSDWSIALTDPLCDDRSAKVSWWIYDSIGLLASGSNSNNDDCTTTRTFHLATTSSGVRRVHTELKACNFWGCSDTQGFDDYF